MKSLSALLFSSLLFSLIMSHNAHAQEFSLVGDWANKDQSSDWWGFIPTQAQWERIDSLQLNWLKVILEQVDPPNTTTSEDILLHQPAHGSYRYIVDRMSTGSLSYQKCNNNNRKSHSTFLARYIMGSFLVRLQPESEFDYEYRNEDCGVVTDDPNAKRTPFVKDPPAYNMIESRTGIQTAGYVAWYPVDNARNGSQLKAAKMQDSFHHLTIRARLWNPPSTNELVYTIHLRYKNNGIWETAASITYHRDDFATPMNQWQEVSEQLSLSSLPGTAGLEKDIVIEWHGLVDVDLDWVEIASTCSHEVLRDPAIEADIRASIAWYNNLDPAKRANIGKLFSTDEVIWPEYRNLQRVNDLIDDELSGAVTGWSYYLDGHPDFYHRWGYYRLSGIREMAMTGWMFHASKMDDGNSEAIFDDLHWAAHGYKHLAETVHRGDLAGREFWPTLQANAQAGLNYRFPYPQEMKAALGIGLSYGARGVIYHNVWGEPGYEGLLGETTHDHRKDTRDSVVVLNGRLRNVLGPYFMSLQWDDTFDGGFDALDVLEGLTLQHTGNAACTQIATRFPGGSGYDQNTFVQVADYHDGIDTDYLFLVNKRMRPDTPSEGERIIELSFNNAASLSFCDVESHRIEVIPAQGTMTKRLQAGDFRLFRIGPELLSSPLEADNIMYIRENATYTLESELTLSGGARLGLEDGATLIVASGGSLVVENSFVEIGNGAELRIESGGVLELDGALIVGEGSIVLGNPQGLRGQGTLLTPNLCIATDFVIPVGTALALEDGGTISFDCGPPGLEHRLHIHGTLRFRGNAAAFSLVGDIVEVLIHDYGLLDVYGSITLGGVPHVQNWNQGEFRTAGLDEAQHCQLLMRDRAEINSASELHMEFTTISTGDPSEEWDGIAVIGPEARSIFRNVHIGRVYCDPVHQGSGIHFYHASNPENLVSHCTIGRSGQTGNFGDAIVLQPGSGTSFATIECTTTAEHWWTGVTAVSSALEITGLNSRGNLRGMGVHLDGSMVTMEQSWLWSNTFEGLFMESGIMFLGKYTDGRNAISYNGDVQVSLAQSASIQQIGPYGRYNDIGDPSLGVPCIITDASSQAQVLYNYWMTPTPSPSLFIEGSPGSILWDPYLTTSATSAFDEWTCTNVLMRRPPRISGIPTRQTLSEYARAGRMTEVYTLLDSAFTHAPTNSERLRVLRELMNMELFHLRAFPDSVQHGRIRFMQYLSGKRSAIPGSSAADLLATRAIYFTFAGFPDSADVEYQQLEQYYPTSAAYRNSLHARLSNAFVRKDSAAIDEALLRMVAVGVDSAIVRLARSERRAFFRCMRSGLLPKHREHASIPAPLPETLEMQVHPNPWTPATILTVLLPEDMNIRVSLLGPDGRELRRLADGYRSRGTLALPVDLSGFPSGVYLCSIQAAGYRGTIQRIVTCR